MRQYMYECSICGKRTNICFEEPYPQYGEEYLQFCKNCEKETPHIMSLTKNARRELQKQEEEQALRQTIIEKCENYGFSCRFLFESVIITTPISSWQFQYHDELKTLRHESTIKINFQTGNYAKTHEQFRERKMTCEEVIDYIAAHDRLRQEMEDYRL